MLIAIGLVALVLFQHKIVMPYVMDIAASGLFLEDAGDEKHLNSTHTFLTDSAFLQCNNYIADELFPNHTLTFSKSPLNAFSLGGYRYILNADVEILTSDSLPFTKRYSCRIKYLEDDDVNGLSESDSWSVEGIDGLDDI